MVYTSFIQFDTHVGQKSLCDAEKAEKRGAAPVVVSQPRKMKNCRTEEPLSTIFCRGLDVQKILNATFQLMSEIGVAFDPDPQVLDYFAKAGCEIKPGNVVKFDRDLVENCLATVSKSA